MIILVALYVFILSIKIYMCVTLTMNYRNIIAETFMLHLAFVLILLHVMSADISKRSLQYYLLFTALTMLLIFTDSLIVTYRAIIHWASCFLRVPAGKVSGLTCMKCLLRIQMSVYHLTNQEYN